MVKPQAGTSSRTWETHLWGNLAPEQPLHNTIRNLPFSFADGMFARIDIFSELLLFNPSPIIPKLRPNFNGFRRNIGRHVALCGKPLEN